MSIPNRPSGQRIPQPLNVLSRSTLLLNNGFATNSAQQMTVADVFVNPSDGLIYALYSCTDNGSNGHYGLAKASNITGPWTDQGALPGVPAFTGITQCRLILSPSNKWSFFYITGTSSGVPALYQTAANASITSTYTQTSAGLLSLGTTGLFDQGRISEVFVFVDQSGTWRMLYMGMPSGNTAEQVGMATATAPEGPWTKVGTTPIIANGAAGSFDNTIDADPNVIYYNGVYYILQSYGGPNDVTGAGCFGMALTTTTDWVTFTKRGITIPPAVAAAGVGDCLSAWAGAFWWPGKTAGDNTAALPAGLSAIYYLYWGKHLSVPDGSSHLVQTYLATIDANSFYSGSALQTTPWTRVEAESGDSRLTTTGTWTTISSGTTFNRGWSGTGFITSNTTNDFQQFAFTGSRCRVSLGEGSSYGIVNILLDGTQVATFDGNYNNALETVAAAVWAYDTGYLTTGKHTLKVQVSGTRNGTATGQNIAVDCWEYM